MGSHKRVFALTQANRAIYPYIMQKCTPLLMISVAAFTAWGCSGRKVDMDTGSAATSHETATDAQKDPKDLKIETLTTSLSRAQTRIEELDAKVSALSDKVEATRIAVDNVAGAKPMRTEAVGSAKTDVGIAREAAEAEKLAAKARVADSKELTTMDSAITEFNKAMALFKNAKYADAELAFNHFTERYPEHVLAGSAQYYAGESYFNMGEYKLALNEFQKVVSSFSSSPRVASAIVRIAHCYDASGNSAESARTMALARDMFEGNPSLDLPAPMKRAKTEMAPTHAAAASSPEQDALKAGPMEPADKHSQETHGHEQKQEHQQEDDKEQ